MALQAEEGKSYEHLYAGRDAPTRSPMDDPSTWGELWGTPPDWMSLEEG